MESGGSPDTRGIALDLDGVLIDGMPFHIEAWDYAFAVSRIERGKREIRLGTLVRLLDGLDARPDALLDGILSSGSNG